MRIDLLIYFMVLFIWMPDLESQSVEPRVGDTLILYSSPMDLGADAHSVLDFYEIDFPCLSRHAIISSEMPRTKYEILNADGQGQLIGFDNSVMLLKGFRKRDPFFDLSDRYIQFIGGIPLIDINDIQNFDFEGSENFSLEYDVNDLPDPIGAWALLAGYSRMRIKVRVEYKTYYKGVLDVQLLNGEPHHALNITYNDIVSSVQFKSRDWNEVALQDIPGQELYLLDRYTAYIAYHKTNDPIPALRLYTEPHLSMEYTSRKMLKALPHCSSDSKQVYVYPNPTYGKLNVRMIGIPLGEYSFDVYNIIGRKMWSTEFINGENNFFSMSLPYLEKGIYLYSIKDKHGHYIQSRRLTILEH